MSIFGISRGREQDADAPQIKSIAVLPFQPLVAQGGDVYLELGMADALITRLSNIRQVSVRPTSAVLMHTAPDRDASEIGRQLGVDAVLDGRLQKSGERVRVTVQLIRVRDGAPLWADTFDEEFTNIFGVQDSISQRMANALTLSLTREERQSLTKRYTENAEAYQLYLRGRYHWYKWTEEGWRKSREYFEQAIELDPDYALAYAGLSDSYSVLGFVAPPRETYLKSKDAALKALELDETLSEAHLSLGALSMFQEWNRPTARGEIERALALNPNIAQAHDLYAIYLASEGRTDEALAESRRALALDPLSPYMSTDLGMNFYYARRYDEALAEVRKALEIDPDYQDGLYYLGAIYEQQGRHAEAVAQWRRIMTLSGDAEMALAVGRAYDAAGYRGALLEWLRLLKARALARYVPPMVFADLYARLGEKEEALAWLERAFEERSMGLIWLKVEPRFDGFHSDARFQEMLRKLNLTP